MQIKYRKELEKTARQIILIHREETLIKLILRTIVRNIKVEHAGMLIFDKNRDEYVVKVSRGYSGIKIPIGLAKVKKDNPMIRYFTDKKLNFPREILFLDKLNRLSQTPKVKRNSKLQKFLEELKLNFSLYHAKACIPGFFRDDLIGILFLGEKKNKKNFLEAELSFLSVLASDVVMAIKNAWLIDDLNQQLQINNRLFLQMVSALASSIEAKDKYTIGHTERVVTVCLIIAENLKRKEKESDWAAFIENLRIAALLHDIGKIGIPEKLLNKKQPLTSKEREIIKTHPLIGANIISNIEALRQALLGVKHHHERYDGQGYPSGIKGKQIPLIAAIVCLADAFDAMTVDRPYRKGFSLEAAIEEIKINRGKQFSPMVVDAFLRGYKKSLIQVPKI